MKKCFKVVMIIFCSCLLRAATAQEGYHPSTLSQQQQFVEQVMKASKEMKTLQCDFVQTKSISILEEEMVSKGVLYYKQPHQLRWEYVTPYPYQFILNDGKVMILSGGKSQVIDVKSSRLFQEISRIILTAIDGSAALDSTRFTFRHERGSDDERLRMTPQQKELKQLFREIRLYFDRHDFSVQRVEIEETSGDSMQIVMSNSQRNQPISDEIFRIY